VHVPFCERICPFCPYNKVRARQDLAVRYFAALDREVDAITGEYRRRFGTPFSSLYVGGGTPTLYPDALADLLARLPTTGERAVEVLPNHATPDRLDRLVTIGFGAVSIGAQSFDDGVLRRLGRPHDAAMARAAVDAAVGRFACVDVDLIVDVALEPHGSGSGSASGSFLSDVEFCFAAGVDQVSTYPLMRFGYTPFGRADHERGREHAVLAQVSDLAQSMGYERRSVWTFDRKGSAPYTSITRRRFLGMGAGATSVTGRDFLVNHFGVATYAAAVETGRLPLARWLHLGRWAGAAYEAFWQAYAGRVSPAVLAEAYGRDVGVLVWAGFAPARWAGLVTRLDGELRLTRKGFDVYHDLERAVTYQFIEPLWAEMLREHATEHADVAPSCQRSAGVSATGLAVTVDARHGAAASWARLENARRGRLWRAARAVMERPVPQPAVTRPREMSGEGRTESR
jgi:oxygen-independent coproporphyrinogen-3 oxidase